MNVYLNAYFREIHFLINRLNVWETKEKQGNWSRSDRQWRDAKHFPKDICNECLEEWEGSHWNHPAGIGSCIEHYNRIGKVKAEK